MSTDLQAAMINKHLPCTSRADGRTTCIVIVRPGNLALSAALHGLLQSSPYKLLEKFQCGMVLAHYATVGFKAMTLILEGLA